MRRAERDFFRKIKGAEESWVAGVLLRPVWLVRRAVGECLRDESTDRELLSRSLLKRREEGVNGISFSAADEKTP